MLARALMLDPDFLVADEPVSMLDVSVRAGILNTMKELARGRGLTIVYISHDLSLIQYLCDRTAIMYLGSLVEIGPTRQVIQHPQHPYTQALIATIPMPDPNRPEHVIPDQRAVFQARSTFLPAVHFTRAAPMPWTSAASKCRLKPRLTA